MAVAVFPSIAEERAAEAGRMPQFGKLNLGHIRDGVENLLKLFGREGIFHEYTVHDMSHVDEMLQLVEFLIPEETRELMTPADWLLIVLSCYFHDIGLLVTRHEWEHRNESDFPAFRKALVEGEENFDYNNRLSRMLDDDREKFYYQEFVRVNHAERIHDWLIGRGAMRFGRADKVIEVLEELLGGVNDLLLQDLALICRSHHLADLDDLEKYRPRRAYSQEPEAHANVHYAALMLRTADLLHIRSNRAPSVMFKLINPTDPIGQEHWVKQRGVNAVLRSESSPDTLEIHASFGDHIGFFGLQALVLYARQELARCYKWNSLARRKAKHFYPWKEIDTSQIEAKGFEPQKYRFELDRMRILEMLTGHTLYNDSTVAIREIAQNALDAVRFRLYCNPEGEPGHVHVEWNSKTRQLVMRDNGTGMTQEIIEDYLFNVGVSSYQTPDFKRKHPDFAPISRFGIGILSTFMIADDVEILTIHPEEEDGFARQIILPSVVQEYLIRKLPPETDAVRPLGQHGTQVTLSVRASAKLEDIAAILTYWIVLPGIKFTLQVDGGKTIEIGFESVTSALNHYYQNQEQESWRTMYDDVKVASASCEGIDVAYVVRHSRFFRVWEFAPIYRGARGEEERLREPPGICVHGVRASSSPPGYNSNSGVWALANLTGTSAPQTNVARSGLDSSTELTQSYELLYGIFGAHIQSEYDRLKDLEAGVAKAAMEAEYLVDLLKGGDLRDATRFEDQISRLQIVPIEIENGCEEVSSKSLESLDQLWTVEGPTVQHIEELCGDLNVALTAQQVVDCLGGSILRIPTPRLLGKSERPLANLEVSAICIDRELPRLDMKWQKPKDRWMEVPNEVWRELRTLHSIQGRAAFMFPGRGFDVEMPENVDVIVDRGSRYFYSPSCSINDLVQRFGLSATIVRWLWVIWKGEEWHVPRQLPSAIPEKSMPLIRADFEASGIDPDEWIPKFRIDPSRVFNMKLFDRKYGVGMG